MMVALPLLLALSAVIGTARAQTTNVPWIAPLPPQVSLPMVERDYRKLLTAVDGELRLCQAQAREPTCLELKIARVRALVGLGRLSEGIEVARLAVAEAEQHLGPSSEIVASALDGLGSALLEQGRVTEGDAAQARAQAIYEGVLGPGDALTIAFTRKRASEMIKRYEPDRAEALLRRSIALAERANPADRYDLGLMIVGLGHALAALDRFGEALAEYHRGIAVMTAARPDEQEDVVLTILAVANVERDLGRIGNAVGLMVGVVERLDRNPELKPIAHNILFEVMDFFGSAERWDLLESVLAHAKQLRDPPPTDMDRWAWRMFEIQLLEARGELRQIERLLRASLQHPPSGTATDWGGRAFDKSNLARLYLRQHRWADGDILLRTLAPQEDAVLRMRGPAAIAHIESLRAYFALGTEDVRRARHHFRRARSSVLDRVGRLRPGEDGSGPLRESFGAFLGQVQTAWLLSGAQRPGAGRRIVEQVFDPSDWTKGKGRAGR